MNSVLGIETIGSNENKPQRLADRTQS